MPFLLMGNKTGCAADRQVKTSEGRATAPNVPLYTPAFHAAFRSPRNRTTPCCVTQGESGKTEYGGTV